MYNVPSSNVSDFVVTLDYAKEQMGKTNLSRLQSV